MRRKHAHWPDTTGNFHAHNYGYDYEWEGQDTALLSLNMKNLILVTMAILAAAVFLTGPRAHSILPKPGMVNVQSHGPSSAGAMNAACTNLECK